MLGNWIGRKYCTWKGLAKDRWIHLFIKGWTWTTWFFLTLTLLKNIVQSVSKLNLLNNYKSRLITVSMRVGRGIVIRGGYRSQLKDRWLDFGTSVGNKEAIRNKEIRYCSCRLKLLDNICTKGNRWRRRKRIGGKADAGCKLLRAVFAFFIWFSFRRGFEFSR